MADQTTRAAAATGAENTPRKQKGRSPSYPSVDLKRALELAKLIYDKEGDHEVASPTVMQHWGMKEGTGNSNTALAALKAYGLFVKFPQRGPQSGKVQLSKLALRILQDERENQSEKEERIKEAALMPSMHKATWDHYKGRLPSDANLKYRLLHELDPKFTPTGADEFIAQFKRTIAFAKLQPGDSVRAADPDNLEDKGEEEPAGTAERQEASSASSGQEQHRPPVATKDQRPGTDRDAGSSKRHMREIPIPIVGGAWPVLKAEFPMTAEAWDHMMTVLGAMKAGLVETPKPRSVDERD